MSIIVTLGPGASAPPPVSIFTPPSSCSTLWTFEDSEFNSVSGGLLLQNALHTPYDTECFPDNVVSDYGRRSHLEVYSPGYCPVGYTTPIQSVDGSTTKIICCRSSYTYLTTIDTDDGGPQLFAGCVSSLPQDSTTGVPYYNSDSYISDHTTVSGPLTMWAQPMQFAYQQKDLSLFTTSSSSAPLGSSSTASPSQTPSAVAAATTSGPPSQSATTTAIAVAGLSPGAKAGIAVGVIAAFLLLVGAGVFLFWRRRRAMKSVGPDLRPDHISWPTTYSEEPKSRNSTVIAPQSPQEIASNERHELPLTTFSQQRIAELYTNPDHR